MEIIDGLTSAARTLYDDVRANENGRFRPWEHCYHVFRDVRTDPLPDYNYLSLHLASYLASWGMRRGPSFLLQKDYKVLSPVVEEVLEPEYDCLLGVVCVGLREGEVQARLTEVNERTSVRFWPIRNDIAGRMVASLVSPVLITKILMGILGCASAYDRSFVGGIKTYEVTTQEYSPKSVLKPVNFYEAHSDRLEETWHGIQADDLTHPQMKLLDMEFRQVGFEKEVEDAK